MSRREQEWTVKLSLMGAIARSQEAIARILANVADVTDAAGVNPKTVEEHVRALVGMQGALLRTVTGKSWHPPVRGTPASPWLNDGIVRSANNRKEAVRHETRKARRPVAEKVRGRNEG